MTKIKQLKEGKFKISWNIFIGIIVAFFPWLCLANDITFVEDGKVEGVIVVDSTDKYINKAAEVLQDVIKKSSGVEIPIVNTVLAGKNVLRITTQGMSGVDKTLIDDGFEIFSPSDGEIVIRGGDTTGASFGVYELLERDLGVRWLFPGELGEVIPQHQTIAFDNQEFQEEPSFFARLTNSALDYDNEEYIEWRLKQRMIWGYDSNIKYNHALGKIFLPEKFGPNGTKGYHPEYYPTINSKKHIPKTYADQYWQPVLSDATKDKAVEILKKWFANGAEWKSLASNDSLGTWGDAAMEEYYPNMSNYYFPWASAVSKGIRQEYPNAKFGVLAYMDLLNPPDKKINDGITPFIAYDRFKWVDSNTKQADKNNTIAWKAKADNLAWWDYPYGSAHYKVPRIYSHVMEDYLKFANNNNIKAYVGAVHPTMIWEEGPKLYVLFKLLWNTDLNADDLSNEWYELTVGSLAAPYLKEYYDFWQNFWENKVVEGDWFKFGQTKINNFMVNYQSTGYLDLLHLADIDYLDNSVQSTLQNTFIQKEQQRAKFFCKSWNYTKKNIFKRVWSNDELLNSENVKLVEDYNFESGMNGWSTWQTSSNLVDFSVEQDRGYLGGKALKFDVPIGKDTEYNEVGGTYIHYIPVEAGKVYKISAKIKVNGFDLSEKIMNSISMQAQVVESDGKMISRDMFVLQKNNDDWQKVSLTVEIPNRQGLRIKLYTGGGFWLTGRGTILLDDVKVTTTKNVAPAPTLLNCDNMPRGNCTTSSLKFCATKEVCEKENVGGYWCSGRCQGNSCIGTVVVRADVSQDNKITATDALLTLKKAVDYNLTKLVEMGWHASITTGDVNCDGEVRATDAMLILKKAVGGYSQGELEGMGWCAG